MAKKAQTQTGSRAIRAVFADAKRLAEDDKLPPDPDPNEARDGILPGRWHGAPHDAMPPHCPVRIIGRDADGVVYAVTATNDFRAVEKWDMPSLVDLFAPQGNYMMWAWPGFGEVKVTDPDTMEEKKKLVVKRVERDKVMMCLKQEAARKPLFDPARQRRGRGGWRDKHDRFIWHSGGWLWSSTGGPNAKLERARPGEHEGFLYTRQPLALEPWAEHVTAEESPALRILQDMRTWNWQRSFLDPILLLGWIGTAIMGGALKARPVVFTTGGAGVGKSTLHELLKIALEGMVTCSVNTTAAGIYQRAKYDSLPFMIDELESKSGSTRAESVIELARVAYTGGDISRGGADHEATSFTAQQSFLFSAINAPPMNAQDKTRMAMLNLARLDKKNGIGRKVVVSAETDGRMMLRQVLDGWADFNKRLLPNYWEALAAQGLDARAIDTFGTLLASAELLVGPEALEEMGLPVTDHTHLGEMIAAATAIERTENLDNWHKCLDILFQSQIEAWRDGVKPTIGGVCERLRSNAPYPDGLTAIDARERLQLVNLSIVPAGKVRPEMGPCLAVPADGPMLKRIFADTEFLSGVWYSALKQAPANIVLRAEGGHQKVKINGSTKHCLLVDLEAFDAYAQALA
ncbi:MAG: hypothetical protein ABTQ31_17175 [Rhizobiaceae bacterium]